MPEPRAAVGRLTMLAERRPVWGGLVSGGALLVLLVALDAAAASRSVGRAPAKNAHTNGASR